MYWGCRMSVTPPQRVHPAELRLPDRADGGGLVDLAVERRPDPVGEVRAVVEDPGGGQLDDRARARVKVGPERVLEVRRVEEAVGPEQPHGLVGDLVERRAVADRRRAGDVGQDARRLQENLLLLRPRLALEPLVEIAVVADLVAAPVDLGDHVRVALGGPPGDEEGGRDPVPVEEVEDQGHADLRAVGALGQDGEPVRVGGIARDPGRLGVQVEGEAHGGLHAARPVDRRSHVMPPEDDPRDTRIVEPVPAGKAASVTSRPGRSGSGRRQSCPTAGGKGANGAWGRGSGHEPSRP